MSTRLNHLFRIGPLYLLVCMIAVACTQPPTLAGALSATPVASLRFDANPTDDPAAIAVAAWNVGLDDASSRVIAERIAAFEDVNLWAIAEVNEPRAATRFAEAAAAGEDADFGHVMGGSGGDMQLLALYDKTRFALLNSYEIDAVNTTGNARAPLVLHLRERSSGLEFLFMVNHLYRSRDEERHKQAQLLNQWARAQSLPIIAAGDYNFDWAVEDGEWEHDTGYDRMTVDNIWQWVRPRRIVTTQCSGWPCRYNSVLDFVFTAGPARAWPAESDIVVMPGDFPDDTTTSDHRPVVARFWPSRGQAGSAHGTPAPGATATPPPPLQPVATTRYAMVNATANLRSGPGKNYAIVGQANLGTPVTVLARSENSGWLLLPNGVWIAAFLVDGAPVGLPVAQPNGQIAPTATPAG